MKSLFKLMLITGLPVLLWSCASQSGTDLFNGKDLENWEVVVDSDEVEPGDLFYVEEGMITTPGTPNGYIQTRESFSNYELHLEWRWPKEPTNSGVFLHIQDNAEGWREFPLCIECQLQNGNAGDIVCIGKGSGITVRDSAYLVTPDKNSPIGIAKYESSSEHAPGEWNSYDIRSENGTITVKVNGVLQNEGSEMTLNEGHIGLQSEGSTIQFRNIHITAL
jgi:hypothetical protein